MISYERPICIYHGGCADGFTAAWAVWKRFGDSFEYYPGIYQNPPPNVAGRDVVIVDFSYKRDVLGKMLESGDVRQANTILILDHHKSAAEDLAGIKRPGQGAFDNGSEAYQPHEWRGGWEQWADWPVRALFDMERSGAGLAWDFFHPGKRRPELVSYVEDRDLWRFKLPASREVNAFVFAHTYDFATWDELAAKCDSDMEGVRKAGAAIERKHHKDVAELVAENRYEMIIGGKWVPVCNLPKTLTSDAGHLMCQPYASPNLQGEIVTPPFAACYWDTRDGRVFSLRSIGDFDVSAIASLYGGGGHKNAAGFRLPHGVSPAEARS